MFVIDAVDIGVVGLGLSFSRRGHAMIMPAWQ